MWGQIGDKEAGCDVAWESQNPSRKTNAPAHDLLYLLPHHRAE